ncbi:MAG: glycosyltransferase family 4 protein [Bacteroidales bacterium]|nr:glycosyltransferase family 4 protein [Bacteroidales bacterium]
MRIAVNTRLLLPHRLDGIGWFAAETLKRIVLSHPEHEFYFFFDRKPDSQFIYADNVCPVVLHPQARHPLLWYMFFEWSVTMALRRLKIDLFLSPDGWMSLRTPVPTLTVIHDLNFEHAVDYLRPSHQRYMKHYFPSFARRATRIATVSEYSKQDISNTYGIDSKKIDVVYDGAHSFYRPCSEGEKATTRQKFTDGKPFFIYVGTISRRKNLTNILLAFDKYKTNRPDDSMQLLVVGSRYWWQDELAEAYDNMRYQSDVRFIGHIESDVLAQLMGASEALVYASLFEGFGIPILEAFYAETVVITSNVTSMPEVAGDAAILVDPLSVEEIAKAMQDVAGNEELKRSLIEKGKERRDMFSWDRTATLLWNSLLQTLDSTK